MGRHVRIDHCNLDAVYHPHSVNTHFAIIEAIIHLLKSGPLEDLDGVLERNAVTRNVPAILLRVPNVFHDVIFTLCLYAPKSARGERVAMARFLCCGFVDTRDLPTT